MPDKVLQVGDLVAKPGERVFGLVEVSAGGQTLRQPVFRLGGQADGPTLAVTGGVHAAEYASIAAALDVGRTVDPMRLHGSVIVMPVVNTPGFPVRAIYVCPLDGKNPNRFFPGNADGSPTEQLTAWVVQNVICQGNYYIDLHGGDLIEALTPFSLFYLSGDDKVDQASREMAQVFGIPDIVRSETPGSGYSAAARAGIPAMLAEAGGQGIWPPEDVALLRTGVDRVMRHLGMLDGPSPAPLPSTLLDRFVWLRSEHDGFWYPGTRCGDAVREGQDLGRITDYEGKVLQTAAAPAGGRVLFLVTSLAINKGDPLLAVGA